MPKCYQGQLQHGSESNSAAIYQSNLLRSEVYFLPSDWKFFWKLGKKEDILDWEWGLISDPGDREKRPGGREQMWQIQEHNQDQSVTPSW